MPNNFQDHMYKHVYNCEVFVHLLHNHSLTLMLLPKLMYGQDSHNTE